MCHKLCFDVTWSQLPCRSFFQYNGGPSLLAAREADPGPEGGSAAAFYSDTPLQVTVGSGASAAPAVAAGDPDTAAEAKTEDSKPLEERPPASSSLGEDPVFLARQQVSSQSLCSIFRCSHVHLGGFLRTGRAHMC